MLRAEMFTVTRNPAKYMLDLHIVRLIHIYLKRGETGAVQLSASVCFGKHVLYYCIYFVGSQFIAYVSMCLLVSL